MNRMVFIISALIALFIPVFGSTQDNPFFSKDTPDKEKRSSSLNVPGCIQNLLHAINELQRELNNSLSTLSRKMNQERDFGFFFLLLAIALTYGFIHALGPGHGKIIMISYTFSNPLQTKQGIWLGIFIAVIHTLSAIFLVSILYFILKGTYSGYSQEPKEIISLISYGLIAVMGIVLLIKTIIIDVFNLKKKGETDSEINIESRKNNIKNLMLPALIIGIVPCEGAVLILIFSISINAYWLGIICAVAMSIGMAGTISLTGIITIYSKKGVLMFSPIKKHAGKIIRTTFHLIGGIVILLFGLLLFFSRIV
jgi:nickel/cobalt exporter